ncbi:SDR family oxidoreductase [Marininema halotolerans]|uniref:3-oxoacyl-[acyl-carrier protein] reductase n=1 Tax=Marininema halotolerans TaxID=1155944 RepID=A0A1I6SH72_9BACL|nr:SDR family oxidoreductase [Marininema halotolerans]SFS76088.1 3-oxoacyl-[acyl-carrier protein] reductase [Marininema halotolerans]
MSEKVAWITGGATGLGVQVAKELAAAGYHVLVNYRRSQKQAEALVETIRNMGREAVAIQGDVSDPLAVKAMVKEAHQRWGRLDVLICTAGPFLFRHISTVDLTDEEWREMIDGNLSSVFYSCRGVIPRMREQGWGRIITFGFPEVETAPAWPGFSAYGAAKVGVTSLTRSLAQEEAPYGITVNMVCPGDIRHPFKEAKIKDARGKLDAKNPVGRPGTGEDLARVIRFLIHKDSDFITGAVIPVTGGFDNRGFQIDK